MIANFVESLDGVVALESAQESGARVSFGKDSDHFVMGLLRACADAIVIGAGTFRRSPTHLWLPERIYPAAAAEFAAARAALALSREPQLVLVSASGKLDPAAPALARAIIVTSREGEQRLAGRVPSSTKIWAYEGALALRAVIERLRAEGARVILSEGGPDLFSQLVAEGLLDELFVTLSPGLFGRFAGDQRRALTHGKDLGGVRLELLSARRDGSHLFLRYSARSPT